MVESSAPNGSQEAAHASLIILWSARGKGVLLRCTNTKGTVASAATQGSIHGMWHMTLLITFVLCLLDV